MADHESMTYTETVSDLRGDMREGFAKIDGQLVALTGALESATKAFATANTDIKDDVRDHEARIRLLERMIWKAAGAAAFIGVVGGWLVTIVF